MRSLLVLAAIGWLTWVPYVAAQEASEPTYQQQVESLNWQRSPSSCRMLAVGGITPTGDLQCLDSAGTRRFLEINGNPPSDNEYTLAPSNVSWFAIFSFDPSGFVKDDEQLDPDAILQTLKDHNREGSAERRQLHLEVLTLLDWYVPPHYNIQTKQLEWGTRLRGEKNEEILNYTIRILGRSGVTSATLVSDPTSFDADLKAFRSALQTYQYLPGEHYEEFRQGDKIAEYGLSALIVGGAAAVAAKSGFAKYVAVLLAAGGKAIFAAVAAAIAAIWAMLKSIIRKVSGNNTPT